MLVCLATAVSSPAGATLDSRTAANGLKEALGVGTSRSVDLLGRPDGYLKNVDVRIPMPEKLHVVDTSLRTIGKGRTTRPPTTCVPTPAPGSTPCSGRSSPDSSIRSGPPDPSTP